MKRWIALAFALIMALGLAACGGQGAAQDADARTERQEAHPPDAAAPDDSAASDEAPSDNAPEDAAEIANPFTDYAAYGEAETAAGFSFRVPEEIGGYDTVSYRVAGTLFEAVYSNGASSLTVRKAPGGWNVSGDNNKYTVEVAETLAGVDVTCWGEEESLFLAMWTAGGYSYSLSASESIDRTEFLGTVETVIALNAD